MAKLLNGSPTTFSLTRGNEGHDLVIKAISEPPLMAACAFGDWLANIRSALDYAFYQLVIHDEQRRPPSRPRDRTFPLQRTQEDFEKLLGKDIFHNLRPTTIKLIESMQPYHTHYGADGNALLWLHDLARLDRHREPFTLGALVKSFNTTIPEAAVPFIHKVECFDPKKEPALVGSSAPIVLARIQCSSVDVAEQLGRLVPVAVEAPVELIDWYREAHSTGRSANIRNDTLEVRMSFTEYFMGLVVDQFERYTASGSGR
ncbi:hypothetical protein [Nocardia farcinica]|nr:hypothetical protein [Nocardia farcinica]